MPRDSRTRRARHLTKHEEQTDTPSPTLPRGRHGRSRDYGQTLAGGVRNGARGRPAHASGCGPRGQPSFALGVPAVLALTASPLVSAAGLPPCREPPPRPSARRMDRMRQRNGIGERMGGERTRRGRRSPFHAIPAAFLERPGMLFAQLRLQIAPDALVRSPISTGLTK